MENQYVVSTENAVSKDPFHVLSSQAKIAKVLHSLDDFLISSLDQEIKFNHRFGQSDGSCMFAVVPELVLPESANEKDRAVLDRYLAECKLLIINSDCGKNTNSFSELLQNLTQKVVEVDVAFQPDFEFDCKFLDQSKLAKVLEKLTSIKQASVMGLKIKFPYSAEQIKIGEKCPVNAVELLGGLKQGTTFYEGILGVKTMTLDEIEKRHEFYMDGRTVKVLFMPSKWVHEYNLGKVRFGRGDAIRAKFALRTSPVNKNDIQILIHEVLEVIRGQELTQESLPGMEEEPLVQ